jgi:hypothetical protein
MEENVNRSILTPVPETNNIPPKKTRSEKIKSFFLTFFVIEHLVILFILLIPTFFLIRAYAFSDFGKLNETATGFVPQDKNEVMKTYSEKYENYLGGFIESDTQTLNYKFDFAESDINTMISDINLDEIEKFYFQFGKDNIVYIWAKPKAIPYPLMFKTSYVYDYENKIFQIKILDWQVGMLSFPASILGFAEDTINKDSWTNVSRFFEEYHMHLVSMTTKEGGVDMEVQIDDKFAFLEKVLNSGEIN